MSPEFVASFWNARYPGQIPEHLVLPEELQGKVIELEGHELVVVEVGHTDTDNTTCLHVPSVGLVVAAQMAAGATHTEFHVNLQCFSNEQICLGLSRRMSDLG